MAYGEAGAETEVFLDWGPVEAFEVGERPIVRLADKSGVVVEVFCAC